MICGFTGTRNILPDIQKEKLKNLLTTLNITEAHHGDCVGADAQFALFMHLLISEDKIHVHPPKDDKERAFSHRPKNILNEEKTHFARNRDIVHASEVMLACPYKNQPEKQGGTWYTIDYTRKQNKPLYIIWPDGRITKERCTE